ncbi:MAG: fixJ [Sphingomonas bacterium]|jgi:two-component system response regulator FixJ|nr:fixJ [Sphingomonas bacterium]
MTDRRTIHLVDDDEAIRRSIGFLLKTSGFDVIAYPSGVDFLAAAGSAIPGCVLLDIRMPDIDGLEVQRRLHDRGISLPVVVLTGHGDVTLAVRAIKAGAVDFLEKPFEKIALLAAIEDAFQRLEDAGRVQVDAGEAAVRLAALTPRERDVLEGLVRGQPNKITAYELGISTRTVEVHRANLMQKLKVRSLSDVLRLSFAAGLGAIETD